MMNEYIITTNSIFIDLNEFYDLFSLEAEVVNEVKCNLLNYDVLEDFQLSNGIAYVYQDGENYQVDYNNLSLYFEIEDKIIVDYRII